MNGTPNPSWIFDLFLRISFILTIGLGLSFFFSRYPAKAHRILVLTLMSCLFAPFLPALIQKYYPISQTVPIIVPEIDWKWIKKSPSPPAQFSLGIKAAENFPSPPKDSAIPAPKSGDSAVSPSISVGSVLSWIWFFVSFFLTLRFVLTWWKTKTVWILSIPLVEETLQQAAIHVQRQWNLKYPIQLLQNGDLRCPVVNCWAKEPVIAIPSGMVQSKDKDWRGVFAHEIAHWKRGDHWAELLAVIVCVAFPWNPLAWWSRNALGRYSEQACDDWAVAYGQDAIDYAETLLTLFPQGKHVFSLPAVGHRNNIERRILRIMNQTTVTPLTNWKWSVSACLAAIALLLTTSILQPLYATVTRVEPFSYTVWDFARLPDAPPILMPMVIHLTEAADSGIRNEGTGPAIKLTIQSETEFAQKTIFVGFFDRSDWLNPPLYVRQFPEPGTFELHDIPAGDYYVGAVVFNPDHFDPYFTEWGDTDEEIEAYNKNCDNEPRIAGVYETWPKPLRIQNGTTNYISLLLSEDFDAAIRFVRGGGSPFEYFRSQAMKNNSGPDPLLSVHIIDANNEPVPFAAIDLTEYTNEGKTHEFHSLTTDRLGYAYCNKIPGKFTISAHRCWYFPDTFIDVYQWKNNRKIYDVRQEPNVTMQWDSLPEGQGSLQATVFDQWKNPVPQYYFRLKHQIGDLLDPSSDSSITLYEIPVVNENGEFEIQGLPNQTFEASIRGFDYAAYLDSFEQKYPVLDFSAESKIVRDFELLQKNLYYGVASKPNGEPFLDGFIQVWYTKRTKEERLHDQFLGEWRGYEIHADGSFRIGLSPEEEEQVLENCDGCVELSDRNGNMVLINLDSLSRDSSKPASIVFQLPSRVENPTTIHP